MNRLLLVAGLTFSIAPSMAVGQWVMQKSGSMQRLRAVDAVDAHVVWASGNHGTILRTTDGGESWRPAGIAGTDSLDFRDIEAFSATAAYAMSIGPGTMSRIYKTTDGGVHWVLSFVNKEPHAFFDAMAFWNDSTGLAVGDELSGRLMVIRTMNGGATWDQPPLEELPHAVRGEGAFAASGTCVTVSPPGFAWIGTGVNCARVYRSWNKGLLWGVTNVPITSSTSSSGVFSVLFLSPSAGVIVGGDFQDTGRADATSAISSDSGMNWTPSKSMPGGFRSCVAAVPGTPGPTLVAVGPTGSDISFDRGGTWSPIDTTGFHAVSFSGPVDAGWAVGEQGRIAKFRGTVTHEVRR